MITEKTQRLLFMEGWQTLCRLFQWCVSGCVDNSLFLCAYMLRVVYRDRWWRVPLGVVSVGVLCVWCCGVLFETRTVARIQDSGEQPAAEETEALSNGAFCADHFFTWSSRYRGGQHPDDKCYATQFYHCNVKGNQSLIISYIHGIAMVGWSLTHEVPWFGWQQPRGEPRRMPRARADTRHGILRVLILAFHNLVYWCII